MDKQPEKKKVNRRRFLITAGGVMGASLLCCSATGIAAMQQPPIEFVSKQIGEGNDMSKKILVAYASKCGSTGEVAEAVAQVLAKSGAVVDVRRVQDVRNIEGYSAVVIGSAARMQKLLPEAVRFAEKHRKALQNVKTAYFSVGIGMKEDTTKSREETAVYLQPLCQVRAPSASLGMFGGKIDVSKLEGLYRLAFSFAKDAMPEGDWRNWDAINAWAEDTAKAILA